MVSPAWWGLFLSFCFQRPCSPAHRQVEVEQELGQCRCPTPAATPPRDIMYRVVLSILPPSYLFCQLRTRRGKTICGFSPWAWGSPAFRAARTGANWTIGVQKVGGGSRWVTLRVGMGLSREREMKRALSLAQAGGLSIPLRFKDFLPSSLHLHQCPEQGKLYWMGH